MRSRINRLEKLHGETLKELDMLGRKVASAMDDFLGDTYRESYYKSVFEVGKQGIAVPTTAVADSHVTDVLRTPWSGKNYSTRIWTNTRKLADSLKRDIVAGVHRGLPVEKMARKVQARMGVGKSESVRLVRTEMNYINNQATMDNLRECGLEFYEFVATLDKRTSSQCRDHDGQVFPIEDASPGTNAPPLHPHCRSVIIGSMKGPKGKKPKGERITKIDDTYMYVPSDMDYAEYKAIYVDKTHTEKEWALKDVKSYQTYLNRHGTQSTVDVITVGSIDRKLFTDITTDIRTRDVVLTNRQIKHIQERHPGDFENYGEFMNDVIEHPDYILKSSKPHTAILLKSILKDGAILKLILRIQTPKDPSVYKNSIITFQRINENRYNRYRKNGDIVFSQNDV